MTALAQPSPWLQTKKARAQPLRSHKGSWSPHTKSHHNLSKQESQPSPTSLENSLAQARDQASSTKHTKQETKQQAPSAPSKRTQPSPWTRSAHTRIHAATSQGRVTKAAGSKTKIQNLKILTIFSTVVSDGKLKRRWYQLHSIINNRRNSTICVFFLNIRSS